MSLKNNPLSNLNNPLGAKPILGGVGSLAPKGINPLGLSNLSNESNHNMSK